MSTTLLCNNSIFDGVEKNDFETPVINSCKEGKRLGGIKECGATRINSPCVKILTNLEF